MPNDSYYRSGVIVFDEFTSSTTNSLSEMFENNRAKKVKIDKNLPKKYAALEKEFNDVKPRLEASRRKVLELEERIRYLESAIEELEK